MTKAASASAAAPTFPSAAATRRRCGTVFLPTLPPCSPRRRSCRESLARFAAGDAALCAQLFLRFFPVFAGAAVPPAGVLPHPVCGVLPGASHPQTAV